MAKKKRKKSKKQREKEAADQRFTDAVERIFEKMRERHVLIHQVIPRMQIGSNSKIDKGVEFTHAKSQLCSGLSDTKLVDHGYHGVSASAPFDTEEVSWISKAWDYEEDNDDPYKWMNS